MSKRSGNEAGAILVFTAFVLLILMGVAAIAVDLGNAWSTRRQAQTAADVAAVGALQEIPRTFATSIPPLAQDEVDALVGLLTTVNAPGAGAIAVVSEDYLEVFVDINAQSRNSFARAIGAGASTNAGARATAMVEIPDVDRLFPVGFELPSEQPYQCIQSSTPQANENLRVCKGGFLDGGNGARNVLIDMRDLAPANCTAGTIDFANGVDHLIDTIDTGTRSEADACAQGHQLTLPTSSTEIVLPVGSTLLKPALIGPGAPLETPQAPLWDYFIPGACSAAESATEIEQKSNAVRSCLKSWASGAGALFVSGLTSSPRFGWGIEVDSNGVDPVDFQDELLLFLHLVVSDDPTAAATDPFGIHLDGSTFPPGENVGAVTLYSLKRGMLSASDDASLRSPFGTDELEFFVIE